MGEEGVTGGAADAKTELEKSRLECQKLRLEIRALKKRWWQKVSTWAIILPLVGGSVWSGVKYYVNEAVLIGRSAHIANMTQNIRAIKTKDLYYQSTVAAKVSSAKKDKITLLEDSL